MARCGGGDIIVDDKGCTRQKPKFRTVERSAGVYAPTRLHSVPVRTMDRRTAVRCGYLATASNLLGLAEGDLPTPQIGESMSRFVRRVKSTRAAAQG